MSIKNSSLREILLICEASVTMFWEEALSGPEGWLAGVLVVPTVRRWRGRGGGEGPREDQWRGGRGTPSCSGKGCEGVRKASRLKGSHKHARKYYYLGSWLCTFITPTIRLQENGYKIQMHRKGNEGWCESSRWSVSWQDEGPVRARDIYEVGGGDVSCVEGRMAVLFHDPYGGQVNRLVILLVMHSLDMIKVNPFVYIYFYILHINIL